DERGGVRARLKRSPAAGMPSSASDQPSPATGVPAAQANGPAPSTVYWVESMNSTVAPAKPANVAASVMRAAPPVALPTLAGSALACSRSEERRVGKECTSAWRRLRHLAASTPG